jgi:hypothetical protein
VQIKEPKSILKKITQLKKLKKKSVVIGFPKGWNPYPNGTSVALIATVHEFGSAIRNIPPRPYFRTTLQKNNFYKSLREMTFKKVIRGELSQSVAMHQLGDTIANDIKDAIIDVDSPALKVETIKNKGSSNPLIDTGHLKQSVTYKVVK